MARSTISAIAPVREGGSAGARLSFTEFLLASEDPRECAERALSWLATHAGARHAVCLVAESIAPRLSVLASHHVPAAKLALYETDLEDGAHPLVAAVSASGSTLLAGDHARTQPLLKPLGGNAVMAIPLPVSEAGIPRIGLLLVAPETPALLCELPWIADRLGQKLCRLRRLRAAEEMELKSQRERELLVKVVNAVPDPILLTDADGRILISNARAEELFSTRPGDTEGRRRAVALNNMLFAAVLASGAQKGAKSARAELLLVHPAQGSDLLFEVESALVNQGQKGIGVVSVLSNVTDLRAATKKMREGYRRLALAEAAVRAERDRLDLIIDSVADPILLTDRDGKLLLMNAPAERLFSIPATAPGETTQRMRANEGQFAAFVSNLFSTGAGLRWRGEIGLVEPLTGQPSPVEAISGKILSEEGEVSAVVTILHDRSEALEKAALYERLKQASEKLEDKVNEATSELLRRNELLQRQHVELERASALKSQFLANMSHEFRTPLNAILGYTSLLLHGVNGDLTAPQRRSLGRVDSNAHNLLLLISDILDITRIEAGKMPLHVDQLELPALASEVLAEVEPLIVRAKLAVTAELSATLPALSTDRQKVKQILLNLLVNAIKFTRQGSVKLSASYDAVADEFSIAVRDTGIGIAESDFQAVFEDFRQADNSNTREYGGAGLGLSICRRLATMLNGRIEIASALGAGSTFTLFLPRKAA
jgi:signal transduction histidine kinase